MELISVVRKRLYCLCSINLKISFFSSRHDFIDTMWSIVHVEETGTLALTQQLLALRTSNLGSSTTQSGAESMEVCFIENVTETLG